MKVEVVQARDGDGEADVESLSLSSVLRPKTTLRLKCALAAASSALPPMPLLLLLPRQQIYRFALLPGFLSTNTK